MNRFTRVAALLVPIVVVFVASSVSASSSYSFNYTVTATGTQTVTTAPDQVFNWTVDGTAIEYWTSSGSSSHTLSNAGAWFGGATGEWETFHVTPPPGSTVTSFSINSSSFTSDPPGYEGSIISAQIRSAHGHYESGYFGGSWVNYPQSLEIVLDPGGYETTSCTWGFCGTTTVSEGFYTVNVTIQYTTPENTPLTASNSGTATVNFNEGLKTVESSALPTFTPLHGGFVYGQSYSVSDDSPDVETSLSGSEVLASTEVISTGTAPWLAKETGVAAVDEGQVDLLVATSSLVAPNGDTVWTVTDDHAQVETSMTGPDVLATGLAAPAGPGTLFNYTVSATGTESVDDYPDETFTWSLTGSGTESWQEMGQSWTTTASGGGGVDNDFIYSSATVEIKEHYVPAPVTGGVITSFARTSQTLDHAEILGETLLGGQLVVTVLYEGYYDDCGSSTFCFPNYATFSATYDLEGFVQHHDALTVTDGGTTTVSAPELDKVIKAGVNEIVALNGGTLSDVTYEVTQDNPRVRIWKSGSDIVAKTPSYGPVTNPWNGSLSGAAIVDPSEGLKSLGPVSLEAPNGDEVVSVSDDSPDVITFLLDGVLYAQAEDDGDGIGDSVDTAPALFSDDFDDGTTTGSILSRGDQSLEITDAPNPADGVLVTALPGGGPAPAVVMVSGGAGAVTLDAGESVILTTSSADIEVLVGPVDATLVGVDGTVATVTIPAGNTLIFDPNTLTVTTPPTNPDVLEITIVDEPGSPTHFVASDTTEVLPSVVPPVVTVPEDFAIEATGPGGAVVVFTSSASDDIDGPLPTVCTPESGTELPLGTHEITCEATDSSGLVGSASFNVTVEDTTAPDLIAPADTTAEATSTDGASPVDLGEPTASDIADPAPLVTNDAPTTFPLGETVVTWRVEDASGNFTEATQTVTVVDTTAPDLVAPADLTVEANTEGGATGIDLGDAVATDIGDPAPIVTNDAPALLPLGDTTVTWTATDASGNSTQATQTVTVVDSTPPDMSGLADVTVEGTETGGANVTLPVPAVSDIADPAPLVACDGIDGYYPLGQTVVTCTAIDASGNVAVGSFTVEVIDTTAPVLTVPADVTVEGNVTGGSDIVVSGATATDIVDPAPVITNDAPALFPLGTTVVTWTATDASGNATSATQEVTVIDTTAPALTVPADVAVEGNVTGGSDIVVSGAVATDIVDPAPVITNDAPVLFPLGTTVVTWTATDASGNATSATQEVTVEDTTAPALAAPADMTVEGNTTDGAIVTLAGATASDVVDPAPVATNDAPALFPLGTTIVTWTATDASGNSTSATQEVTVVDTTPPSLVMPADFVVEGNTFGGADVDIPGAVAFDTVDELPDVECLPIGQTFVPLGTTSVDCTATDASGNSSSASYQVTVIDTTPPDLALPADIVVEGDSTGGATVILPAATATDIVDHAPVVACGLPSAVAIHVALGLTTVHCTATDASGNVVVGSFTVEVIDTTPPVLVVPADVTVEGNVTGGSDLIVSGAAATDIVDPAPVITNDAPALFPLGTTVVTWTATDASGNSTSATQEVTVIDTTAPALTVPADVTVEGNVTGGSDIVVSGAAATDIVDPAPVITNDAPALFPLGTTVVTWTATDASGNSTSATQEVTVVDTTPPVLVMPADFVVEGNTFGGADVDIPGAVAFDTVDELPDVECLPIGQTFVPLGTTSVDCTATDASGNSSSASYQVTVIDTTPPALTVPGDITVLATDSSGATVSFAATAVDIVDPAPVATCSPTSGTVFPIGATDVTCTASDASGNASTASFTVTVLGGRSLVQAAANALSPFENDDERFRNAVRELQKALSDSLWADEIHPNGRNGQQVFSRVRSAIQHLEHLRTHGVGRGKNSGPLSSEQDAAVETAINNLLTSARILVSTAIEDAAGLSPSRLASAERYFAEALAESDPSDAVHLFRKAWEHANKAIEKAAGLSGGDDEDQDDEGDDDEEDDDEDEDGNDGEKGRGRD